MTQGLLATVIGNRGSKVCFLLLQSVCDSKHSHADCHEAAIGLRPPALSRMAAVSDLLPSNRTTDRFLITGTGGFDQKRPSRGSRADVAQLQGICP